MKVCFLKKKKKTKEIDDEPEHIHSSKVSESNGYVGSDLFY